MCTRVGRLAPVVLVAAALAYAPAAAQESTISASRPGAADNVAALGPGMLQMEGGYSLHRTDHLTEHAAGELLVRYGVGSGVELRVGLTSYAWESTHGFSEGAWEGTSFGGKVRVLDAGHGWLPGLAVSGGVSAHDPAGADFVVTPELNGHVEWHVGHDWTVLGRAGVFWAEHDDEALWAAALGYHATHDLHLHLEWERHGAAPWAGHAAAHESTLTAAGASWVLMPNLVVDGWAGIEDEHGHRSTRFGFGAAWRWTGSQPQHGPAHH
jgi:hypothetical protein